MYSISSSRYLKNLLETEVIESIWSQDPEQDHFYALSSLNNEFKVLKVQIPSGNILKKLKWNKNIDVPEKTLKILPDFKVQDDDKVVLDRVYFLSKQKNQIQLTCQLNENGKKMNFGQVDLDPKGAPIADFNADIVVKVCQAITGQVGSKIHLYTSLGVTSWSQKLDKKRPITFLKCAPKGVSFATGDQSGKIRAWRGQSNFVEGHWHSLPIEALDFSLEGTHLYSGGGEGVIVKWEVKTMARLALVPRMGTNLIKITNSYDRVIAATKHNTMKVFSSNLEEQTAIVGLSAKEVTKLKWHSGSLVLISSDHHLQFFNPLYSTQKHSLEVVSQNVVLGEREGEEKTPNTKIVDFDLMESWLATIEQCWDGKFVLKIWNSFENFAKIEKVATFNEVHDDDITFMKFIAIQGDKVGILTCSKDKTAKLWVYEDEQWFPSKIFRHAALVPESGSQSTDGSVLAIAFGSLIALYDLTDLSLMTILHSNHVEEPYNSLHFGQGFRSRLLFSANVQGVFVWDLISMGLVGKFKGENASIFSDKDQIIVKNSDGVFALDANLTSTKLSPGLVNAQAIATAQDRVYFKEGKQLKFIRTRIVQDKIIDDKAGAKDKIAETLRSQLNQLKVTVDEDIYNARKEAPVDPESITKKLSLCSESIIKRVLPV